MRMWLSGQRGETGTFKDRTINTVPSPHGLRQGEVLGATVSGGGEATASPRGSGHDALRSWAVTV